MSTSALRTTRATVAGRPVRVLVVDDSALVRKLLSEILNADPGIEVVGTAPDPLIARDRIRQLEPDVLTLDIEMPRMDGITFLRKLMRLRPLPVVMVSSITEKGADVTLEALEIGAVDFVSKPKSDLSGTFGDYAEEIVRKVRAASRARVRAHVPARGPEPSLDADAVLSRAPVARRRPRGDRLLAIGASTGGTEAIKVILADLPADAPGVVIAQHIPAAFSASFARRLNASCPLSVAEAKDGAAVLAGHAYVAPGGRHLIVERDGARLRCRLSDGPPVNRHRPSVDVLFRSVAASAGSNAVGLILTGMGDDGARGLLEMKESGAETIAQDEASSVVWGMPGGAVKRGAAGAVLPLPRIARELLARIR